MLLVFAALPAVAPILRAGHYLAPADMIFGGYAWVCHQMPSRSWFLFGQQMAYCERNTAIYGAMAVCGLLWPRLRAFLPKPRFWMYSVACLPMALDGFSQLVGMRESNWELRTLTGALFGAACIWYGFPLLERYLTYMRCQLA